MVSLSPSTTESLYAIGAGDVVVGRSRYCDYPPAVTHLPIVGGFVDASLETILGLSPSLVVGARGPGGRGVVDALSARGIATYFPETESVAQVEEMIRGLGQRLGRLPEAASVTLAMARDRGSLAEQLSLVPGPRPRVLLLFGLSPIVAAGPLGFPHEMLTLSGCDNAILRPELRRSAYPTLSLEQVLAADPDAVLLTAAMSEGEPALPSTFQPLRAVRDKRVVAIAGDEVLRPGPRLAGGQRAIAMAAHPGLSLR